MKNLLLFLVLTVSCYAGDVIGNTYFDDQNVQHAIQTDKAGRYYVEGDMTIRIDGGPVAKAANVQWDGLGYLVTSKTGGGYYVDSPLTMIPVIMLGQNMLGPKTSGKGKAANTSSPAPKSTVYKNPSFKMTREPYGFGAPSGKMINSNNGASHGRAGYPGGYVPAARFGK